MKIGFLSCGADKMPKSMLVKTKIAPTLRIFADNPPVFSDYPDFASLEAPLRNALKSCGLVLILAAVPVFSRFKEDFLAEFAPETETRRGILDVINTNFDGIPFSEAKKHCVFPENSEIFPRGDGLYSGFTACAQGKPVVVLPFDAEHTVRLVCEDLIPLLSSVTGITRAADDFAAYRELCGVIAGAHTSVAVALTPVSDFFRRPGMLTDGQPDGFRFSRKKSVRGDSSPEEYAARIASEAASELSCLYGLAMTGIMTKEDKYYVVTALSSENGTETAEYIFEKTDETVNALSAAANELFTGLSAKIKREIAAEADEGADFETF